MASLKTQFEQFLAGIGLKKFRKKYKPIKIVEMDLDREIIPVYFIIKVYWKNKEFLPFNAFYKKYLAEYKKKLEKFRKKVQMCKKCFYKGLEARVYRTWVSLLTQIQGAFVAAEVFGQENIHMNGALDVEKGVDFQIRHNKKTCNIHISKISQSREVRQARPKPKHLLPGVHILLPYLVWRPSKTGRTHWKNGTPLKWFIDSQLKEAGERLPNGFIIFKTELLEDLKRAIEKNKLKEEGYLFYK